MSELSSQTLTTKALAPSGGKMVIILAPKVESEDLRPEVTSMHTLIYTSLGREFKLGDTAFPASAEDRAHMASFLKYVPELVKEGKIQPNKVHFWEGGLEAINSGLDFMFEGKVSGEKIVYRLK